jgi:DNA replication protein DnaC
VGALLFLSRAATQGRPYSPFSRIGVLPPCYDFAMPVLELVPETCPVCGGRGWVVVADGGAGKARTCSCQARGVVPRLMAASGIPPRYRSCRLSNFHVSSARSRVEPQLLEAKTIAQRYVDEFVVEGGGFRQAGLLLLGPPGVGKTHLAVAILGELIEKYRVKGCFVEFTSLIHQIQATFDPGTLESKSKILEILSGAEFLVLDELGAQQTTPWVRDILYLIINNRYTRRLPTVFTTNYRLVASKARQLAKGSPDKKEENLDRGRDSEEEPVWEETQLSYRLPPMLVSRLYEMAQPVVLDAVDDFRRENAGAHLR